MTENTERHEEDEEFPGVLARCSTEDLRTLGERLLKAERHET
jgi:hypothetical protein